jgi:hypothetical protein
MKAQYQEKSESERRKYPFENRWIRHLEQMVEDCDRMMARNRQRVADEKAAFVLFHSFLLYWYC